MTSLPCILRIIKVFLFVLWKRIFSSRAGHRMSIARLGSSLLSWATFVKDGLVIWRQLCSFLLGQVTKPVQSPHQLREWGQFVAQFYSTCCCYFLKKILYIYIYCISWVSELLYIWASICEGARLALISCYQKCVVVFWVPEILDNVSIPSPSILLCWERRLWNCLSMSIIEVSSPDLLTREYVHMIRLQGSLRDEKIISY